jgi:HTH-type transcriptional regulator/antitoxin HigA
MTLTFDKTQYSQLLFQYQPKIIKTEAENEKALTIVERLMHQKIVVWKRMHYMIY